MSFANPEFLLLFWVLVPLGLFFFFELRHARRTIPVVVNEVNREVFWIGWIRYWLLSSTCLLLFVVCSVLALANPVWGTDFEAEERQDLDLVVVLDISRSMLVQDLVPNRLSRAKEAIVGLLADLPNARIGVVLARGVSAIAVPVTEDRMIVEQVLANAELGYLTGAGTDLGGGIDLAIKAFPRAGSRYRTILLATDGEDLGTRSELSAREAADLGIPIICVGVGTAAGGPVPAASGPAKDEHGRTVISRLDRQRLVSIASLSRGKYVESSDYRTFSRLGELVSSFQQTRARQGFRLRDVSHEHLFGIGAVIFLVLSVAANLVRRRVQ